MCSLENKEKALFFPLMSNLCGNWYKILLITQIFQHHTGLTETGMYCKSSLIRL